jgi:acyl-coenzyme A synthetase/AMP-(fatty) acid ligase
MLRMEGLPKTATGKIEQVAVREIAAGRLGK